MVVGNLLHLLTYLSRGLSNNNRQRVGNCAKCSDLIFQFSLHTLLASRALKYDNLRSGPHSDGMKTDVLLTNVQKTRLWDTATVQRV